MGFSVSGSAAMIFVGMFVAFGMFHTATANGFESVSEAQQDRTDRTLTRQNTAIDLTTATYDGTNDVLTVEVTNNGSSQLEVSETDLLVDNAYISGFDTSVDDDGSTDLWLPGERLTITVTGVDTGPSNVKVVSGPGVADTETGVA